MLARTITNIDQSPTPTRTDMCLNPRPSLCVGCACLSADCVYMGMYQLELECHGRCYVNGVPLDSGSHSELVHGDRLVIGPCSHLFSVVDPQMRDRLQEQSQGKRGSKGKDSRGSNDSTAMTTPTYEMAVREVLLRKAESAEQRGQRLSRMVLARWRAPLWRRLFEEALVTALQSVAEANEISAALDTGKPHVPRFIFSVHECVSGTHMGVSIRLHMRARERAVSQPPSCIHTQIHWILDPGYRCALCGSLGL